MARTAATIDRDSGGVAQQAGSLDPYRHVAIIGYGRIVRYPKIDLIQTRLPGCVSGEFGSNRNAGDSHNNPGRICVTKPRTPKRNDLAGLGRICELIWYGTAVRRELLSRIRK